uniref:RRM domain-containing protein n=2 Tax=Homalodisca liturata TaxID=320908 RepID=A0A1B6HE41_9HEMI
MTKTFKIHVGNLSSDTREEDLLPLFRKYGEVIEFIIKDYFGFLHMKDEESGAAVLKNLNGHLVRGHHIRLHIATNKDGPRTQLKKDVNANMVDRKESIHKAGQRIFRPSRPSPEHKPEMNATNSRSIKGVSQDADGPSSTNFVVRNVPPKISIREIEELFQKYGKVKKCSSDYEHVFVCLICPDVELVLSELNGTKFKGQHIEVKVATGPVNEQPSSPSREHCVRLEKKCSASITFTSALNKAIEEGSISSCKGLLDAGVTPINEVFPRELHPLMLAIKLQRSDITELLIKNGANIHVLLPQDKFHSFNLFTDNGSEYFQNHKDGLSCYQLAVIYRNIFVVRCFWRLGCLVADDDIHLLSEHIVPGDSSVLQHTEETKKAITQQLNFLKGIETNNYIQVFSALTHGAEIKGHSGSVRFPIHFATRKGFHNVLHVLVNWATEVDSVDDQGLRPIQIAVEAGDLKCCQILLENGACYNSVETIPGSEGVNNLLENIEQAFFFASKGYIEILKLFMQVVDKENYHLLNVFLNCTNSEGKTLIAAAVANGHFEVVRNLVKLRTGTSLSELVKVHTLYEKTVME